MSEQRDVVSSSGNSRLLSELRGLTVEDLKRRNARVVSRGVTLDSLDVPNLPEDLCGVWVHKSDVFEYEARNYVVDNEFAVKRPLQELHGHSDGTNKAVVGDTVFMITTKANREALELLDKERYENMNRPKQLTGKESLDGEGLKEGENFRVTSVQHSERNVGHIDVIKAKEAMIAEQNPQSNNN